jgi:hypothetical protein
LLPAVNAFAIIYNPPDAGGHVAIRFLTRISELRYKRCNQGLDWAHAKNRWELLFVVN